MPSATVIGAGVFGAWVAHALRVRGWAVTLVEQHGPGNSKSSSGGETRIIRSGYGDVAIYSRWAHQSLVEWLKLERRGGTTLFTRTGALFLGADSSWLQATASTLRSDQLPFEWLDGRELTTRFPQLHFPDTTGAVFEPNAGVLFARRAVQELVRTLVEDGVRLVHQRLDPAAELRDQRSDALIFACGAWLPSLFPEVLRDAITPTRQEVFFFGVPAGDRRFDAVHLPAWVAFDEGLYGVPDLEHRGVKVAIDAHGPEVDPETMERVVDAASVARVREALRLHLPALADAPLLESRVCQYENTADGHFLLDRLPGHDRAWIAGGGSGHGFKHGPAVGSYVAELIEGAQGEAAFRLAGRPAPRRAVF
jgi:glycine/D-amino acid oxidase-like deaminating enzyme